MYSMLLHLISISPSSLFFSPFTTSKAFASCIITILPEGSYIRLLIEECLVTTIPILAARPLFSHGGLTRMAKGFTCTRMSTSSLIIIIKNWNPLKKLVEAEGIFKDWMADYKYPDIFMLEKGLALCIDFLPKVWKGVPLVNVKILTDFMAWL